MTAELLSIPVADVDVIADLVRVGCAAVAAYPIARTDAVHAMNRERRLRIGKAFLDLVDPNTDRDAQNPAQNLQGDLLGETS